MTGAAPASTVRASRREDLVTMALVSWTIIGIFVDAYFHATDAGLESFWTPWHGLFYSGFTATAAWIILLSLRRRVGEQSIIAAAPAGYRGALLGIGLFALGGLGDAVWHTLFGVETSIDALLSPTHLVLFVGATLIASAPLRAAWSDPHDRSNLGWKTFLAPALGLTWTAALVAFMLAYAVLLTDGELPRSAFTPGRGDTEFVAAYGVLSAIVTTAILVAPILLVLRRWYVLPAGAITLFTVVIVAMVALGFDRDLAGLVPAVLAGVVGDLLVRLERPWMIAATYPLVLWSAYFVVAGQSGTGLGWPPEIWGGIIFFSVLTALGIQGLLVLGSTAPALSPSMDEFERRL